MIIPELHKDKLGSEYMSLQVPKCPENSSQQKLIFTETTGRIIPSPNAPELALHRNSLQTTLTD